MLTSAVANDSILGRSRLVVGSSNANTPQFKQNVSANAKRITIDANTFVSSTLTRRTQTVDG